MNEPYINSDCGCVEWSGNIGLAEVVVHLEPNGKGEAFINLGDWEEEKYFLSDGINDLKNKVANYIKSLPAENDEKN